MTGTDPAAVVRRFYEEVFNQQREDVIDDLLTEDYRDHGAQPPRVGRAAAKENLRGLQAGFDDIRFVIHDLFSVDDRVAVRWTGHLTHSRDFAGRPATGRQIEFSGNSIYVLRGGLIAENFPAQDLFGLFRQLDV